MRADKIINARNDGEFVTAAEKPVETFYLQADPLTGERFDVPESAQFRKCIPVYDALTGELREFLL